MLVIMSYLESRQSTLTLGEKGRQYMFVDIIILINKLHTMRIYSPHHCPLVAHREQVIYPISQNVRQVYM